MSRDPLDIVVLGLSITSSWGNGHATTYRCLLGALAERGHRVHFLERDVPWYAAHRDLPDPPFCRTSLYATLEELADCHAGSVREADLVIVGSFVPDGIAVGDWVLDEARGVTAFYDIDTPVTLDRLRAGEPLYLDPGQISRYDLYLSFTGGPTLHELETRYGSPMARALYCSADPDPEPPELSGNGEATSYDLGYMGTYSDDRQPVLDSLLLEPSRRRPDFRFVVAGPRYPAGIDWPENVHRIEHLSPDRHRDFYRAQRFTLNVTRADMVAAGFSPSVRLFEAAACGTPIISDWWKGLDAFFTPEREILVSRSPKETLEILERLPEEERHELGLRARTRLVAEHTPAHRAEALEGYVASLAVQRKVS
jgi:spore maturation protein CgeB